MTDRLFKRGGVGVCLLITYRRAVLTRTHLVEMVLAILSHPRNRYCPVAAGERVAVEGGHSRSNLTVLICYLLIALWVIELVEAHLARPANIQLFICTRPS